MSTSTATAPVLTVGIPKEIHDGERRVAATPATVAALQKMGLRVVVASGAGEGATFADAAYAEAGAAIVSAQDAWRLADIVLKVRPPQALPDGGHEADLIKPGAALVGFIWPAQNQELVQRLAARKATVLGMDCMPRITRAQSMDALSATANLAG